MVSLVRNGSRSIYITTRNIDSLVSFLEDNLNAKEMDIQVIQDRSREYQTLIIIHDLLTNDNDDIQKVRSLLIPFEPISVLSAIIRYPETDMIVETIQPGANLIIMRAAGNLDNVIKAIQKDMGGQLTSFSDYITNDNSDYTVIGLTEKPLSKGVYVSDFNENFLTLEGEYGKIKRELRMQALYYLNIGIDNKDWNEVEIRIYDIFGAYNLQYDRMMEVFDDLEIGIVLGESWSKDYPKALLSVQVYRVRFFTFKEPSELKRILFGLEYLGDGTRIVDYDAYYKNKKIGWVNNLNRKQRKIADRDKEALIARNELLEMLSEDTIKNIEEIEKDIIDSRW